MRHIFFYWLLLIVCHSASAQRDTIKDIDGNVYKTVKIGSQVWMAENLKTAHYRDGSTIRELELGSFWRTAGESNTGGWCYYENDSGNNPTYGKLYNWYAVADTHHLCPTGWHVPSDHEWTVLTHYLGGDTVAGGKMKATTLWERTNKGANNSSGFTALPAGDRYSRGTFYSLGYVGSFWSSTEVDSDESLYRFVNSNCANVITVHDLKETGFSVRCVGD